MPPMKFPGIGRLLLLLLVSPSFPPVVLVLLLAVVVLLELERLVVDDDAAEEAEPDDAVREFARFFGISHVANLTKKYNWITVVYCSLSLSDDGD